MTTGCGAVDVAANTSRETPRSLPPVFTDEITVELQIVLVAVYRRSALVVVTLVQL